MDILKVKTNNSWVGIPAIKGEKGDPGDPADPTELIDDSSTTDTDKVWSAAKSFTEISDLNQSKADAIDVTDETPEAVKTIADGADGLPMALTIGIEPVQDLHGYDSPWPGEGGKNLLPPLTAETKNGVTLAISDGVITLNTASGGATADTYFDVEASLSANEGDAYYLYAFNPSVGSSRLSLFVISSTGNPQVNLNSINASYSSYVSADTTITKFRLRVPSGEVLSNFKLSPYYQIGGTAPTAFSPYSNICPISGWTGCNVSRTGVNVWDEQWEVGTISNTGAPIPGSNDTIRSKNFIPCEPGAEYYITKYGNSSGAWVFGIYQYDAEKSYIGMASISNITKKFTTDSNAYYLKFRTYVAYGTTYQNDISINYPATDTQYHPGHVNTYSISFPSEAGTVYGGTLTVNKDGTGELVVDMATTDLGNYNWTKITNTQNNAVFYADITGKALNFNFICSDYETYTGGRNTMSNGQITTYNTAGYAYRVVVQDDRYQESTESQFKTAMSGVQLVYELATPIVYDLTDLEVIETLKGNNNIFADTGDILSVDYSADTKSYIDKGDHVQDVQINGTSILNNGVANVPVAGPDTFGVIKQGSGLSVDTNGKLYANFANSARIKAGTASNYMLTPALQNESAFYGLAKAAGADMASSSNPVGTYTENAKSAISQMLDAPETVSGTTPTITAKPGVRYVCGECATLSITAPASGIIDVTFESGSTPTVLTVTPPTGMTMKWIGEDPTALEANKTYEVNIKDGCLGMVVSWT